MTLAFCLNIIAILHHTSNSCNIIDIQRKSLIKPVTCSTVYKTCNRLFIKQFPIMQAGKDGNRL